MFQSFEDACDPSLAAARVAGLRAEMARQKLDGFLVPHADKYQGEYLGARDERLMWLTGFSGSAGAGVVMKDRAAIFVDGRYTIQAARQVDSSVFAHQNLVAGAIATWLKDNASGGSRIGYDPWLHTIAAIKHLRGACTRSGVELVPVTENPIDMVWPDQPDAPIGAIVPHGLAFSGQSTADKLANLRGVLKKSGDDACILTLSDSICWLFNIRGADVIHTPIAQAFAVVSVEEALFFTNPKKLDQAARDWLAPHAHIVPEEDLAAALDEFGDNMETVRLDPGSAADWIGLRLEASGAATHQTADPTILPKACKNETEAGGTRAAHARDGAAMARFLAWFDGEVPGGTLDEVTCARKLEQFRGQTNQLLDISFDTISASGPNAALPHYRVSTESNRPIENGSFYLVDSGGQYRDGTTDITRTVAVGEVTAEMRRRYTQVLKGHIAIATARFPQGTNGTQLDTLARLPLWLSGEDFDHGTGHGVGSYLSVHEGPQRISKAGNVALEPGMIVSNEPGFYAEGTFGIRIENLILVTEATEIEGGSRPMLGFETLSFTPIDVKPLALDLMTDVEIEWLNAYHAETRARHQGQLDGDDLAWLRAATGPVRRAGS